MNVLITSAGRRVSLVRAFQTELRSAFPRGMVIAADLDPDLSAACQIADRHFPVPPIDDGNYGSALLEICRHQAVSIVVPTIDTELPVLAEARERFAAEGIHLIVSDPEFVATCADKRRTADFFEARGISTPQIFDKERLSFPLFVKPYDGSLSADASLINSADELQDRHLSNERLLFMEYFDPRVHDEYTVDAYFDRDGCLVCAVPRRRIFVRAGEINKGVTSKTALLPLLRDRLAQVSGARGCVNMQFFVSRDGDRTIALEINARFGGGYPLSYRAGANYPRWIIEEYLRQQNVDYWEAWEDNLLMLRYDDEVIVHGFTRP